MIILVFCLIIAAILFNIINPGKRLRKHYQNNPVNAFIYITDANTETECIGKRIKEVDKGQTYKYNYKGEQCFVIVPKDYPYIYLYSKRKIYINDGEIVPFNLFGESTAFSKDDINAVLSSHIHCDVVKSIQGKSMGGVMVVVIIIIVGIIGFYLYTNTDIFTGKPNQVQPANTTTIDKNVPLAE